MSSAPKDSKRTTKEKAAEARAAAEAEQRRRDNRIRIIGGAALVVVVGLIIGLAIHGSQSNTAATGVVNEAAVPAGVSASGSTPWGVPAAKAVAGKPTLAIWEDFQCPVCASFEKANGAAVLKLATDGKVNLVWRPTTFIDNNFPNSPNPKSSHRAAMAWGCAVDAGKTTQYHSALFSTQAKTEGDGWTDQQFTDLATQVGITGDALTSFQSCYNDKKFDQWVTNSYTQFQTDAIAGTPSAYLNGKEVPNATLYDAAALEKLIASTPAS